MPRILTLVFLIGALYACQTKPSPEPSFDFSAIEPFWEIMDTLAKDLEPSEHLWEKMLGTPGYKTLIENEFKYSWMQSYLRHAVMPSKQTESREWAAKGYWDTIFHCHLREVYAHRKDIEDFIQVINNPDFIHQSVAIAREYWPDQKVPAGVPPISFLFFSMDARGYNPVVIDLYFALDRYRKGQLYELIAHEIHHYYRNQVLSFNLPPDDSPDQQVVHVLNQVHMEGVADQIDKRKSLANPFYASQNERYQKLLKTTPEDLMSLDSLLAIYPETPDSLKPKIARQIARSTPNSGHPMGYFMSTIIRESLSMDEVLSDIGNPFQFFINYNRAAASHPADVPVFSDEAINCLSTLESVYGK